MQIWKQIFCPALMEDSNHPGLSLPGATDDTTDTSPQKNVKIKYLFTL